MFLLIPMLNKANRPSGSYLHSTMFLLIRVLYYEQII